MTVAATRTLLIRVTKVFRLRNSAAGPLNRGIVAVRQRRGNASLAEHAALSARLTYDLEDQSDATSTGCQHQIFRPERTGRQAEPRLTLALGCRSSRATPTRPWQRPINCGWAGCAEAWQRS